MKVKTTVKAGIPSAVAGGGAGNDYIGCKSPLAMCPPPKVVQP